MQLQGVRIGEKQVSPFTTPSGIIMTEPSCAARLLRMIPELGIYSTKTITLEAKLGFREPITAQLDYSPGTFVNAVGLANPGAEEFSRRLSAANIPEDRAILASIGGKDADELIQVARILESRVDAYELNLSCPHVKGHGMALGLDARLVYETVKAVVQAIKKPVFVKLTPQAVNIGEIAKAAIDAGAYGIVAINTVGPGEYVFDGHTVLSNKVGGISGKAILPQGLRCAREIRQAIGEKPVLIGMGGISVARDAIDYFAFANAVGIGTGLVGRKEDELKQYFSVLNADIENGTDDVSSLFNKGADMKYRKVSVVHNHVFGDNNDLAIIQTNYYFRAKPGQFVFAWLPGLGEKPFSIVSDDPLTLGVQRRGKCTEVLCSLNVGDQFYVRGPHGQGVELPEDLETVLVSGGAGAFGLYMLAEKMPGFNPITTLLGAKDRAHVIGEDHFKKFGDVYVATEDGTAGIAGKVTDLFYSVPEIEGSVFYNCGSGAMIDALIPLELGLTQPENVYSSQDFLTKCGVGLCGSCADALGRRSCVEGPFMHPE